MAPKSKTGLVSFIVPTKDSERTISNCLTSIKGQLGQDIEVIVVDNHSTDRTPAIAAELADMHLTLGPERSVQRNAGFEAAQGEVVVFVDSDMVLPPLLAAEIAGLFADSSVEAVVIPESVEGETFWLKCRGLEKSLYDGDDSVEAARAFRRSTLFEVGGYNAQLTGGEDWELPDRVKRSTKGRQARTQARILHDETGLTPWTSFQKKRYYGASMGRFLTESKNRPVTRSLRGRLFRQTFAQLPAQRQYVLGLWTLKAFEFSGIAVGVLSALVKQRRHSVTPVIEKTGVR